jgi:GTPase SAR1 family protein
MRSGSDSSPKALALAHELEEIGPPTEFSDERRLTAIAWSPDGNELAMCRRDGTLVLWDPETEQTRTVRLPSSVLALRWSPDGSLIACASSALNKVWILESRHLQLIRTLREEVHAITDVAWSPDCELLAVGTKAGTVTLWSAATWREHQTLDLGLVSVRAIAWSPSGDVLACGLSHGGVHVWQRATSEEPAREIPTKGGSIVDLAWAPDGTRFATANDDRTICIYNRRGWVLEAIVEGHTGAVENITYSHDGAVLASCAADRTVRALRTSDNELITTFKPPRDSSNREQSPSAISRVRPSGLLAFNPRGSLLAFVPHDRKHVTLLDYRADIGGTELGVSFHYCNAKVVLVGDTGVGKSGLGLVLAGEGYQATDSTHGRTIWSLAHTAQPPDRRLETEVYLWDLAGQPGYRLTHQLHLTEVAVAVTVFDARSEIDPLAGVRHWVRALEQARHVSPHFSSPLTKILVAARCDRGAVSLGRRRLERAQEEYGFAAYLETSAKAGWGIDQLRQAILDAIDWSELPQVSSTELFTRVRRFLVEQRRAGRVLATEHDLLCAFTAAEYAETPIEDLREEFRTSVGRADARGLVRRLSFGGLILLRPELLDSYAAAVVNAAKSEPDGAGHVNESFVYSGRFAMSQEDRIDDADTEKLLLIATVEDLLRFEIALRDQDEDGTYLVFPSEIMRETPSAPLPKMRTIRFTFEGPVQHVYATLIVRLVRGGAFSVREMWRNGAVAETVDGDCGITCVEISDGKGCVEVYADSEQSPSLQQFVDYVEAHLRRRAAPGTVVKERIRYCPGCAWEIDAALIERLQARGREAFLCPACQETINIATSVSSGRVDRTRLLAMNRNADDQAEVEAATATLQGKERTADFDVFIAYSGQDKEFAQDLALVLKHRGIYPWIDTEEVPPGRWFQDVIQQVVPTTKAVAVLIGPGGVGRWQAVEIRAFLSECIEREIPVIPVLLPYVTSFPRSLSFLRELNHVAFARRPDEVKPLGQLVWGITGQRPSMLDADAS